MSPHSIATAASPTHHTGLHGHPLDGALIRACCAEAVGTFVLVLAIIGVAITASLTMPVAGAAYSSETVALAGGFALLIIVASLGALSGAHVNPAVTIALAIDHRFPWARVPAYLIAQFAGSIVAALAAWVLYGPSARTDAGLGATAPAPGVNVGRVFLIEAVATFILMMVVMAVVIDTPAGPAVTALSIGLALSVAILISGPVSGAGVNPARALGPMLVAGRLTDWWAYLLAPIVGAAAAALTRSRLDSARHQPDVSADSGANKAERAR
ncbi:MIP/aquaporin family protein [Catellatospora paridis]|uniref:MIP/aquaporin family protein n=1 Tax=Catellatospora paridis TaxID=1617086 RepID=UPI0012D4B196|nr:aquaporin [Catellatospora paridis]